MRTRWRDLFWQLKVFDFKSLTKDAFAQINVTLLERVKESLRLDWLPDFDEIAEHVEHFDGLFQAKGEIAPVRNDDKPKHPVMGQYADELDNKTEDGLNCVEFTGKHYIVENNERRNVIRRTERIYVPPHYIPSDVSSTVGSMTSGPSRPMLRLSSSCGHDRSMGARSTRG